MILGPTLIFLSINAHAQNNVDWSQPPVACIEDAVPGVELEAIAAHYKRVAGFDPVTLNATPA